jgi:outer membrane receptor protein involved in Fe transport
MKTSRQSVRRTRLSASIAVILGTAGAAAAIAPAGAQEPGDGLEEVLVTGSRIVQRDFTANSPIVSVDADLFENSSTIAVEYVLNQLPQFVPAVTQFVTGEVQNSPTVTAGANTISLRGLGSNRNLVLIDGRRAQPVNALLTVDTNTIPSAAIERVEVMTGGASATYGADAIGGVVNFILKKDFEGIELDVQTGETELGDGGETRVAALFGANFEEGRGNVMIGLEYYDREVAPQAGREFFDLRNFDPTVNGTEGFGTNTYYLGGTNQPSQAAINSIFSAAAPGSVGRATEFHFNRGDRTVYSGNDADGAYRYTDSGERALGAGVFKRAADGTIDENQPFSFVSTPLDRYSLFGRGRFDINDHVSVYGQANFVQTQNRTLLLWSPAVTIWNASIPYGTGVYAPSLLTNGSTNPDYLAGGRFGLNCQATGGCTNSQAFPVPADLTTLLNSRANPNDVWFLNRGMDYVGPRRTENTSQTFQTMVGVTGGLEGIDGSWDAYFSHGETDTTSELQGFGDLQAYRNIVQSPNYGRTAAINGPGGAGFGTARCTTGLPIFEQFSVSSDCISAVSANMTDLTFIQQDIAEISVQGRVTEYGPGEIRFAAGGSYRENDFTFDTAALSSGTNSTSTVVGLFARNSTRGAIDVTDVFGELLVPVINDKAFVQEMSLELGARRSDYSTGEAINTYKALMNLEFGPLVRFRGGWQRANRAANIGELFTPDSQQVRGTSFGDACNQTNSTAPWGANPTANATFAAAQALCSQLMGPVGAAAFYGAPRVGGGPGIVVVVERGNETLGSEQADTRTVGLVISPENFDISVDLYEIDIDGAIGVESYDIVYEQCLSPAANPTQDPNHPFCQRITRDQTTGAQQRVLAQFGNLGKFQTSGVDVQFSWRKTLNGGGGISVSTLANWLDEYKTQDLPTAPILENVGTGGRGGQFDYRLFNTFNYFNGPFGGSLRWRYYPALEHASAVQSPATTTRGSESYNIFDFNGRYTISETYEVRFGIDNVLDEDPPIYGATPTNSGQGSTLSGYYDTLGRRWYMGFKAQF